jgi:DNA invertase Pin-like site-specific DNA recombinase
MATTAYLRVSTGTQDLANQKLAILEYARRKDFPINEFVEVQISSRKKPHQRGIDGILERLAPGDRLIVSELSRLGRSLGQVIHIVDELVKRKIRFTAIKESIHFEGAGLADQGYGCLVRPIRRGREGLDLRADTRRIGIRPRQGSTAGRPKGVLGKSRLDGKEEEIRLLLQKQVSKASIAKILGVTRPTIHRFIKTRRLRP